MEENTKIELPAIAVRGLVPLPNNEFKIEVGRPNSILALDASEKMYDGNIILLVQKDANVVNATPEDVELVGALAKVTLKLKLSNNNYRVKFKVTNRIKVTEYTSADPYFVVAYEKLFSVLANDEKETALIKNISSEIAQAGQTLFSSPDEIARLILNGTYADVLSDVIAYQLKLSGNLSKYLYLEETVVSQRLDMILQDIERERQIVEIENKINKDVKKYIDDSQEEYYLR
jgi:ATP-dependent Lon protease